jgi:hypothetical protein
MDQGVSFGLRAAAQCPILVDLDEEPPALINLLAENYRFNLAARHLPLPSVPPPSRAALISILLDASHARQTSRVVHFLPHADDAVPRNASTFDLQAAIAEHNIACHERQQLAIHRAARRCESHQASPRISYERQPLKIAITAPARQQPRRGRQRQIAHEKLGETLTISKVAVPGKKRMKSAKPIVREEADQRNAEVKSAPRRYRSPPPRMSGRKLLSVKCAVRDHSLQIQQLAESASDA